MHGCHLVVESGLICCEAASVYTLFKLPHISIPRVIPYSGKTLFELATLIVLVGSLAFAVEHSPELALVSIYLVDDDLDELPLLADDSQVQDVSLADSLDLLAHALVVSTLGGGHMQ